MLRWWLGPSVLRVVFLALVSCLAACDPQQERPGWVAEARLGIFYGGQIQERQELPRVFEAAKQSQGFRVVLREPLKSDVSVRWQVEKPSAGKALHVTRVGESVLRAGQTRLDQSVSFEPGDPEGLWNVRVLVGDELVIDRPWLVYDPAARRRAASAAQH